MKKFFLNFTILAVTGLLFVSLFTACNKEEVADTLSLLPDENIVFESEGGSVTVTVETNLDNWDVECDPDWCTITKEDNSFVVSAVKNESSDPMPDALLTVTAGSLVKTLKISQKGAEIPVPPSDYFSFAGTEYDVKSAIITKISNYYYVFLSEEEGLDSVDDFMATDGEGDPLYEYLMAVVESDALNNELDFTAGSAYFFAFYNMTSVTEGAFVSAAADDDSEIDAGTMTVALDVGGEASIRFSFTLLSGDTFEGVCDCEYIAPEEVANYITFDTQGEVQTKDVRAAFLDEQPAKVAVYLSVAAIDSARDLENVFQYVKLEAAYALTSGSTVDISSASAPFAFEFYDNLNEEWYGSSSDELNGATGTFTIFEKSTGWVVEFDISVDGYNFTGKYSGEYITYDLSRPNGYTANGTYVAINSVVVDMSGDVYGFYYSNQSDITTVEGMAGADIIIKVPAADMRYGSYISFSNSHSMSITYDGMTYNHANANDDSTDVFGGNTKIENLAAASGAITAEFTLYGIPSISGHYSGACTVIE